jgi:hypothetical protein
MEKLVMILAVLFIGTAVAQGAYESWDASVTIEGGEQYAVPFDYISSGDMITGAFQTVDGKKINFYISKERAGNEAPLVRQYIIEGYEFNVTIPYMKNTETNENESFHGKYLVIFDNTRSTEPVTVNYRMAVIPVEQIAQPERGGLLGGITNTIKRLLG